MSPVRRVLRVAAIVYLSYLALALLVITPLLNFLPHRYLEQHYGRELASKWVLLNPFTLSLELRDTTLHDPDGTAFVHLGAASVNLSLESLWRPGWVLDTIALGGLDVLVRRDAAGAFNFDDLLAGSEPEPEPAPEPDGALPAVTVHAINLQANTLAYSDLSRERPLDSRWKALQVEVQGLSTITEAGQPYSLQIEGENGGVLQWQGTVSIPGAASEGQLQLSELYVPKLWEIAEPWLGFIISDGRFDLDGNYAVTWGEAFTYRVSGGSLALSGLAIDPRKPQDLPDTALRLRRLAVDGIAVDGAAQRAEVGAVTIDGLALSGWQEDGRISPAELFTLAADDSGDPASGADEESAWQAAVGSVRLADSELQWRSPYTDPATLTIRPIEAAVDNISWPFAGDTGLSLKLTANDQASIGVTGELALASGSGDIQFQLQGLPLTWFNPNLPAALQAHFTDGTLAVEGATGLAEFMPTQIALDGVFSNVSARRDGAEAELTGLDTLRLEAVRVDMVEHTLGLKRVALDNYRGRIHIAEDGSINASNVWKEEVGEEAEQIAEDLTQDKPWQFELPIVLITDSEIDFMDQSLPIPFRAVVGELNGEIDNITSAPGQSAAVDLKGSVDGYAPVTLSGGFNAFASPPALDLNLVFNGVDMALLSPYSATYMGYVIDQGILNLDLNYGLKDNHLEGNNKVRMDQLKLGEKIDSDKAIDAPLKLALAVMTDASGVIDLAVPVSGDVNNPSFELGAVISKAFLNIITKAVTAPFKLLANLVGSEQDLQRLTFSSGSAELGDRGRAKLDDLAAALQQRPGLVLSIAGRLNPTGDRERLQRSELQAQLLAAGLPREELDSKGPQWEEAISERFEALPAAPPDSAETTALERYEAVARSIEVSDQQLLELALQREVAVKTYLVNVAGLPADRAVVTKVSLEDEGHDFSGVMLDIRN